MRRLAALLVFATSLVLAASAHAHPAIDEARALMNRADFAGALRALELASSANDFSRDDLAQFFAMRAILLHSLERGDEASADLARLAAIAPDFVPPADMPASMVDELRRLSEAAPALELTVEVTEEDDGIVLRAAVARAVELSLVREIRLAARTGAGRAWRRSTGELRVPHGAHRSVEYHALAVSLGGAPIAAAGSETAPLRIEVGAHEEPAPFSTDVEASDEGPAIWPWLIVGAGVALAAGVVLFLGFVEPGVFEPSTEFEGPAIDW
jgi:hypothetical protein